MQERTRPERSVAQPAGQTLQQPKERAVKSTSPGPQPTAQERATHDNKAMPPPAPPPQAGKPEAKPKPEENKAKEKDHP